MHYLLSCRTILPLAIGCHLMSMCHSIWPPCWMCAFRQGGCPPSGTECLIFLSSRRGDKAHLANIIPRPISVSVALAKLYAVVLNNSSLPWLESHPLRTLTQVFAHGLAHLTPSLACAIQWISVLARGSHDMCVLWVSLRLGKASVGSIRLQTLKGTWM